MNNTTHKKKSGEKEKFNKNPLRKLWKNNYKDRVCVLLLCVCIPDIPGHWVSPNLQWQTCNPILSTIYNRPENWVFLQRLQIFRWNLSLPQKTKQNSTDSFN